MARYWGPGLVLTASVVGTGEVIGVPALGAQAGYGLLWLVLASCLVKLPLQLLIGRHALRTGQTTLQMMSDLPGPRWRASWFVWGTLAMIAVTNFQMGAMIGGCAQVLVLVFPGSPPDAWAAALVVLTILLLTLGGYGLLERLATLLVVALSIATLVCVGFLQGTPHAVAPGELLAGLWPRLSRDEVALALGVFAITGIGTTEIIQYPYWCLDKGYARAAGPHTDTPDWAARARGWVRVMHADAMLSMVVYTLITLAFYLLGASVLHRLGELPRGLSMVATLSRMFTETLGPWAFGLFLAGVFCALYSTLIVSVAANTALALDGLRLLGVHRLHDPATHERWRRGFVAALPLAQLGLYFVLRDPVAMVTLGGLAQSVMLPATALAIVYLRHRRLDRQLLPSRALDVTLWIACALVTAVSSYGVWTLLRRPGS